MKFGLVVRACEIMSSSGGDTYTNVHVHEQNTKCHALGMLAGR